MCSYEPLAIYVGEQRKYPITSPSTVRLNSKGVILNGLLEDTPAGDYNIVADPVQSSGIPLDYAIGINSDKASLKLNTTAISLDIVDPRFSPDSEGNLSDSEVPELRDSNNLLAHLMTGIEYTLCNKTFYEITITLKEDDNKKGEDIVLKPYESYDSLADRNVSGKTRGDVMQDMYGGNTTTTFTLDPTKFNTVSYTYKFWGGNGITIDAGTAWNNGQPFHFRDKDVEYNQDWKAYFSSESEIDHATKAKKWTFIKGVKYVFYLSFTNLSQFGDIEIYTKPSNYSSEKTKATLKEANVLEITIPDDANLLYYVDKDGTENHLRVTDPSHTDYNDSHHTDAWYINSVMNNASNDP